MIGVHKLIILGFYDFLISYLKPHQREVTQILAYLAQSSHELVPPDALSTVITAIADNFVWSNCASEVITAGLNALREICTRCPLAMPEELLKSLMDDYKNHREKGPMNAARGLLGLFREINPSMLKKKDRGKSATINMKSFKNTVYGQVDVFNTVDGADLLLEDEEAEDDEEVEESDDEAPELIPIGEEGDEEELVLESGDELELDSGDELELESDDELELEDDEQPSVIYEEDESAEVKQSPVKRRKLAQEKVSWSDTDLYR
jgi:protein SDA1